jgi:iron complex transport system permease protein
MPRHHVLTLAFVAISATSLLAALVIGTFPVSLLQVLDSLVFPAPGVVHDVIWQSRAPRAAAAFACGGLLALAGAWLQMLPASVPAGGHGPGISSAVRVGAIVAVVAGASAALTQVAALSAVAAVLLAAGMAGVGQAAALALAGMGERLRYRVLPLAGMLGGSLLTLADTFARL